MKAAQISGYGDTSVIDINEVEVPVIRPGHVLVDVYAASINPFDIKLRSGAMKDSMPLTFPMTIGGDFAGIVLDVGEGVSHVKAGDKVYGQAYDLGTASGSFAEIALARAEHIALAPSNVTFEEAGALPLVGASAVQGMSEHIDLRAGQRIFITGGGGGIGSIAIQIAKHIGAYVATTATGGDIPFVKQWGADEIIDYKQQDPTDVLHDFDAVFDTVGGDTFNHSLEVLKQGGVAISMATPVEASRAEQLGIRAFMQLTDVSTALLGELRTLVEQDVVTVRIGKVFSLSQTREAFETREDGTFHGKAVVQVKQDVNL